MNNNSSNHGQLVKEAGKKVVVVVGPHLILLVDDKKRVFQVEANKTAYFAAHILTPFEKYNRTHFRVY